MARPAKPWYRKSNDSWYACLNGKQVRLAIGKASRTEAYREFSRLSGLPPSPVFSEPLTLGTIIDDFLQYQQDKIEPKSWRLSQCFLQSFLASAGDIPAESIKPHHVESWLQSHPRWGDTTRNCAVGFVKHCFRHTKSGGALSVNLIADVKQPRAKIRESEITTEQAQRIFAATPDRGFREYLIALWSTGCRPGEIARATAANFDREASVLWVRDKIRRKTGKEMRPVRIPPVSFEIFTQRADLYPVGPLFRNRRGNAWVDTQLAGRFQHYQRIGILAVGQVLYSFRHGFATDALVAGVPIATVSALLGHRDTKMVTRVYSKLEDRDDHMANAVSMVRPNVTPERGGTSEPAEPIAEVSEVPQSIPEKPRPLPRSRPRPRKSSGKRRLPRT